MGLPWIFWLAIGFDVDVSTLAYPKGKVTRSFQLTSLLRQVLFQDTPVLCRHPGIDPCWVLAVIFVFFSCLGLDVNTDLVLIEGS